MPAIPQDVLFDGLTFFTRRTVRERSYLLIFSRPSTRTGSTAAGLSRMPWTTSPTSARPASARPALERRDAPAHTSNGVGDFVGDPQSKTAVNGANRLRAKSPSKAAEIGHNRTVQHVAATAVRATSKPTVAGSNPAAPASQSR